MKKQNEELRKKRRAAKKILCQIVDQSSVENLNEVEFILRRLG